MCLGWLVVFQEQSDQYSHDDTSIYMPKMYLILRDLTTIDIGCLREQSSVLVLDEFDKKSLSYNDISDNAWLKLCLKEDLFSSRGDEYFQIQKKPMQYNLFNAARQQYD